METLLLSLALVIVIFCFGMENVKLRKTIKTDRGLSDQSFLATQQALNDLRRNMYSNSDSLHKNLVRQISDLSRTCGQEDGKLHDIAITTTEEIEGLKAALASQVDAQFNALEDIKVRDAQTRAELASLKRDVESKQKDQEKPKNTLKKSRK